MSASGAGGIQRERFVGDRDRAIEVAGGGVRDGEHIERVGVAPQRQRRRRARRAARLLRDCRTDASGAAASSDARLEIAVTQSGFSSSARRNRATASGKSPSARETRPDIQMRFAQLRIDARGFAERRQRRLRPPELKERRSKVVVRDGVVRPQGERALVLRHGVLETARAGERGAVVEVRRPPSPASASAPPRSAERPRPAGSAPCRARRCRRAAPRDWARVGSAIPGRWRRSPSTLRGTSGRAAAARPAFS